MITATNKATGEVIELESSTPEQIVEAWKIAQEYVKAAKALKDQLKTLIPTLINSNGTSETINGAMFRLTTVQRMTYDKSAVRNILDEDTFDLFTKIDKPKLDEYIKENLELLGDDSTALRQSMVEDGTAYQVIKLEKLK